MSISEMNELNNLETMWAEHREYLRRMLIGLSRDIDLAEDLLQETYLRARDGLASYRGGSSQAWLAAIAKNVFYGHARKSHVKSEIPMDSDEHETEAPIGSPTHIASLQVREAVDKLTDTLRKALILRHYGGFSYSEIGERMDCPTGTARRRVWTAIRQLRSALGPVFEEAAAMLCEQIRGTKLLDYLYGSLSGRKKEDIQSHLEQCPACREEAEEIKRIITVLDAASDDFKLTRIIDIDSSGIPTDYTWWSTTNKSDQPKTHDNWAIYKDTTVEYLTIMGEEVMLDALPGSNSRQHNYVIELPTPVPPEERQESLLVTRDYGDDTRARKTAENKWRYHLATCPNTAKEWLQFLAIKLPEGARLISAEPTPTEIKTNGTTTLLWRSLLPKLYLRTLEQYYQFECTVDYHLDAEEAPQGMPEEPSEWARTHIRWAPDVVYEMNSISWFAPGDQALDIFHRAKQENVTLSFSWFSLALTLWYQEIYPEALEAFERVINNPESLKIVRYASLAWQGHILDTMGRREEAISKYEQALAMNIGNEYMQHSYIVWIDDQWVRRRIKTPYVREPKFLPELEKIIPLVDEIPYTPGENRTPNALPIIRKLGLPSNRQYYRLGLALFHEMHYAEALEAFAEAKHHPCPYPELNQEYEYITLIWQGICLDLLGRRSEALAAYQQALELDVEDPIRHEPVPARWKVEASDHWIREHLKRPYGRD